MGSKLQMNVLKLIPTILLAISLIISSACAPEQPVSEDDVVELKEKVVTAIKEEVQKQQEGNEIDYLKFDAIRTAGITTDH